VEQALVRISGHDRRPALAASRDRVNLPQIQPRRLRLPVTVEAPRLENGPGGVSSRRGYSDPGAEQNKEPRRNDTSIHRSNCKASQKSKGQNSKVKSASPRPRAHSVERKTLLTFDF